MDASTKRIKDAIDKLELPIYTWYTDIKGNMLHISDLYKFIDQPVFAHVCYPSETVVRIYAVNKYGGYDSDKPLRVVRSVTNDFNGLIAAYMTTSGDYTLEEAIGLMRLACGKCIAKLARKYLPSDILHNTNIDRLINDTRDCCLCEYLKDNNSDYYRKDYVSDMELLKELGIMGGNENA